MARMTVPRFVAKKAAGEKLALLTAYDFPFALIIDEAGIDAILVGDSCAMTVMGRETTLGITVDELLHHTKTVAAGASNCLVIADLPFMSYQISPEEAVRNAGRFVAEGGAHCVKLEGPPRRIGRAIHAILDADIPVMGHLGLTPQSIHQFGGFKVQGRDKAAREQMKLDALELEKIGCFGVVLECVPPDLAQEISASLSIPVIGIGAGSGCDGQILVIYDILGWGKTRFSKTFADVRGLLSSAVGDYIREVKSETFPAKEHEYQ